MPPSILSNPEPTDRTDWRVPHTSGQFDAVLKRVPKNGDWWVIRKGLGMTSAEQQARAMNGQSSGGWQFGYRVYAAADGSFTSDLAVRWVA